MLFGPRKNDQSQTRPQPTTHQQKDFPFFSFLFPLFFFSTERRTREQRGKRDEREQDTKSLFVTNKATLHLPPPPLPRCQKKRKEKPKKKSNNDQKERKKERGRPDERKLNEK